MPLAIQPMQWGSLAELQDTPNLDETDMACLEAVRQVLAQHGKLERFAVHLAHTLAGVEAMMMLTKGQVRGVAANDVPAQRSFVHRAFGLAA
jgi:hypothetical protein